MRTIRRSAWIPAGLGLALATGCSSTPAEHSGPSVVPDSSMAALAEPADPPSVYAPMDTGGTIESVHEYLLERYDVDGDERITSEEYARESGHFDRLDKDSDGVLTAADFERRTGRAEQTKAQQARMSVARYFQDDDDHETLSRDELIVAFATYDTSGDECVDVEEFTCAAEPRLAGAPEMSRRMARAMRDVDPWKAIVGGADADSDGVIALAELTDYFDERDDGDGEWYLGGSDRGGEARGGSDRPMSGPEEGTVAPDFTLAPPEGGEPVTLSDYRGDRSVALVFGSYT